MCGIAGEVSSDGSASAHVTQMLDAVGHRGPDDRGMWSGPEIGLTLGSCRLAIIDLTPGARQPMADEQGFRIVVNGEIYNYIELREELVRLGVRFRTESDTEVLLASYATWGRRCLDRLNGMFALAIWDPRQRELFCARDRFGEKPFYYYHAPGRFLFASEMKALLAHPSVKVTPDERALVKFLVLARTDGEETTSFRGIQQLRPGHWLTVGRNGLRAGRYWDLQDGGSARHDEESVGVFRSLFTDSVRLRLRSDVPIGSSLSGGLDSSSVVATVRGGLGAEGTQQTFSARYRVGSTDEGSYIEMLRRSLDVVGNEVWIEPSSLVDEIEQVVWHQEEPFASSSVYAQWKVMQLAKARGVTVLLDGQGADESLAGYPSLAFGGRFAGLMPLHLRAVASELRGFFQHQPAGSLLRFVAAGLLPPKAALLVRERLTHVRDVVRGELLDRYRDSFLSAPRAFRSPLRARLYAALTETSLPDLLRYADRNSMAHSREVRLPFLDHRLVEMVFTLPDEALVSRGYTKVILRRAVEGIVPDPVRRRTDKIGFATPQDIWLRGEACTWAEGVMRQAATRDPYKSGAVERHWGRFMSGQVDSSLVWRIISLELWMRRFGMA